MSVANAPLNSVQSLQRQHCQIEALLEALESRLECHEIANRSLVSLFNSLATHLQIHFELEEDFYFSGVIPRNAKFSKEGDRLMREHDKILNAAKELVEVSRETFSKSLNLNHLTELFEAFCKRLRAHEQEEDRFLDSVFSQLSD